MVESYRNGRFVCNKSGCAKPRWPKQAPHLKTVTARNRHLGRYHQEEVKVVWEGKAISIARDPATRKFPCPCGAPKHARREADKIRALCKDFDPHPGPGAEKAMEVDTDDENANPAPGEAPRSLRRTKRRARQSPSPDRRAGKRRATGPRPDDDSDDDEPIIVEGPSKVDSGGLATSRLGGATNISAYGGIEHATGSRSALRKPFASSRGQDDLERQVKSLAALNLKARREYIESLEEQSLVLLQAAEHTKELTRRVRQMNDKRF
ncbi:hypothetical protein K523DRAFT_417960 [Schizophyllum commune Tattone D]|nr:hypothetical protein K523DRAFT_417960 [Schizophyllum commune Tattone D]